MKLKEMTLSQLHKVVVAHESLSAAAQALGVAPGTLGAHLGRYTHNEAPLSFEILKDCALEEGPQVFGEAYQQLMKARRVDLTTFTLEQIHAVIVVHKSLGAAAQALEIGRAHV